MGKKVVLLTLLPLFLLLLMGKTAAQPRTVGVGVGEWLKYDVSSSFSSNDTSAKPIFPEILLSTQWITGDVTAISGTNITAQATEHLANGTEILSSLWIDAATGNAPNDTGLPIFVSANLTAGDAVYTQPKGWGPWETATINETIMRAYAGGVRETNHLNVTNAMTIDTAQFDYSENDYWDKSTGAIVEFLLEYSNQTGSYITTGSLHFVIADSNMWVVIPEFPTWTSTLLIIIVLTPVAMVLSKRRLLKTSIH